MGYRGAILKQKRTSSSSSFSSLVIFGGGSSVGSQRRIGRRPRRRSAQNTCCGLGRFVVGGSFGGSLFVLSLCVVVTSVTACCVIVVDFRHGAVDGPSKPLRGVVVARAVWTPVENSNTILFAHYKCLSPPRTPPGTILPDDCVTRTILATFSSLDF